MKQKIMLCLFFIIGVKTMAQIRFEKGYFIDNNNQKVECLIKNESWNVDNGTFQYKVSENQKIITKGFNAINEISIGEALKYQRYEVEIDINVSSNLNNLSADRSINLQKASLLLKVLIEGKTSLYSSNYNEFKRFFYTTKEFEAPKQLIYKKYLTKSGSTRELNNYKQVLGKDFSCDAKSIRNLDKLPYSRSGLERFFKKYNECKSETYIIFNEFKKIKRLFFKVKGGISYINLNIDRPGENFFDFPFSINYDSKIVPTFGFELEYFFPIRTNNWSIFIDPKFKSFSGSQSVQTRSSISNQPNEQIDVSLRIIDIPFNIRFYKFLGNSKLSFNIGMIFSNILNSSIVSDLQNGFVFASILNSPLRTNFTPTFGIGYHKNKYGIELKYSDRNIFDNSPIFTTGYQNIDLTLSYIIF